MMLIVRYYLLLALSFIFYNARGQHSIHGTYCIAAICNDGIIIAIDTRMAVVPDSSKATLNKVSAYRDTVQKVFPIRKFAIASIGQIYFGDLSFHTYLSEFEKTISKRATITVGKDSLYQFIYSRHKKYIEQFMTLKLIFAGYENGRPYLCAMQNGSWNMAADDGFAAADDFSGFEKLYSQRYSSKHMIPIVVKCINDYVIQSNKQHTVGGPIVVLKITPNNEFSWETVRPTFKQWSRLSTFYRDYFNGLVNMNFPSEGDKKDFEGFAKEYLLQFKR